VFTNSRLSKHTNTSINIEQQTNTFYLLSSCYQSLSYLLKCEQFPGVLTKLVNETVLEVYDEKIIPLN